MENRAGFQTDDNIVALATPLAESAVAMIRTSGKESIELASKLFSAGKKLFNAKHHQAFFGSLKDPKSGEEIDEVMILVYRAPGGYTGENAVEFMSHGSLPGIELILKLLTSNGFRAAEPGEFTFRAFINGRIDLTQAEAVNELISSRSRVSHKMALSRLSGSLSNQINSAKEILIKASGMVEIQLDYPGDEVDDEILLPINEIESAKSIIDKLLDTYSVGKLYREGVRIALCGKTNSGKSSLFNLLLKEERSIVSDIHGTTRDYLESWISLKGIPVLLFDTAGLRETSDPIEAEGIKRATEVINSADFILYVIDSQTGESEEDREFLAGHRERCLTIWNKIDIGKKAKPQGAIPLSAVTGEGFSEMEQWLLSHLKLRKENEGEAIIDSFRQKTTLERASVALSEVLKGLRMESDLFEIPLDGVAVDLKEALDALGELTGEVTTTDVLKKMFSDFCVGK